MRQTYVLRNALIAGNAARFIQSLPIDPDRPLVVRIEPERRTLDQNALMWPLLECLADQAIWHGIKLSKEEWKDLLSAGIVKMKSVPNLDGTGFVMLGQSTSRMEKALFSELIELIYAVGAEKGVDFSWGERQLRDQGLRT